jgi:NADH:ubiquinone oxidoreductase subunit F (NADH-binding)
VCCLHGGEAVRAAIDAAAAGRDICVERTSCLGLCDRAPAALIGLEPCGPLSESNANEVFAGWRGHASSYTEPLDGEMRVAMERIGRIDPDDIRSAIDHGAYQSLKTVLQGNPNNVLEAVVQSGLQGRGGAGFPTGRKWRFVADALGSPKYVVCNADESEPAAFKDRVLMEGDPHLMLEGMALAGYAVGASQGYIYIRGEYETAARRLERAIAHAEHQGWLGNDIQKSGFSFSVHLHRGAGAYICGEETALLESLEGRRGEPRIRPPYPTTHGLYGKPTVVNNVETFCKAPVILARGPQWYRSLGTASSPGTKLFTVTGHINRPGAFEAPFGTTLRQVIDQFAGGMQNGSKFKMALTGGAAGTIVGPSAIDVPLDFAAQENGVALGCGALFVMDQSVSVLKLLGWLLHFFEVESCGKCTPCREGTQVVRQIVERLQCRKVQTGDLDRLAQFSELLRVTSLCGLGQSVAWPINSAMTNFPEEFPTTV